MERPHLKTKPRVVPPLLPSLCFRPPTRRATADRQSHLRFLLPQVILCCPFLTLSRHWRWAGQRSKEVTELSLANEAFHSVHSPGRSASPNLSCISRLGSRATTTTAAAIREGPKKKNSVGGRKKKMQNYHPHPRCTTTPPSLCRPGPARFYLVECTSMHPLPAPAAVKKVNRPPLPSLPPAEQATRRIMTCGLEGMHFAEPRGWPCFCSRDPHTTVAPANDLHLRSCIRRTADTWDTRRKFVSRPAGGRLVSQQEKKAWTTPLPTHPPPSLCILAVSRQPGRGSSPPSVPSTPRSPLVSLPYASCP